MSKFNVGNPWKTGKKNSERKGIRAKARYALKRKDKGVLRKLQRQSVKEIHHEGR